MTDNFRKHYMLKGKKVVTTKDLFVWADWFEKSGKSRIVKQTTLKSGKWVSTVFLGLNYNFGTGKPLLFETIVFQSKKKLRELEMDRYSTWSEAEMGHNQMLSKWNKK